MKLLLRSCSVTWTTFYFFSEMQSTFPLASNHEATIILNKLWNLISFLFPFLVKKSLYLVLARVSASILKRSKLKCAKTLRLNTMMSWRKIKYFCKQICTNNKASHKLYKSDAIFESICTFMDCFWKSFWLCKPHRWLFSSD